MQYTLAMNFQCGLEKWISSRNRCGTSEATEETIRFKGKTNSPNTQNNHHSNLRGFIVCLLNSQLTDLPVRILTI